jgi:hypothetical protein
MKISGDKIERLIRKLGVHTTVEVIACLYDVPESCVRTAEEASCLRFMPWKPKP